MTTALYARISDDRRDGVGVESQLQACRDWCTTEGWAPVQEYVDNDVSASVYSKKPRRQYAALIRAVEAGEVDRIVCFATDRLYRQPRELEHLIPLAEKIAVHSKVGGLIDLGTAGGRLNARIQASIAANESDIKSERVRLAQQRNRTAGNPHGGPRPFGWLATKDGHRSWDPRRHDEYEADLIRQAAAAVLAGTAVSEIATQWNAAGIRQSRAGAGRWHPTTIRSMLTNPRNAGLVGHKGVALMPGDWPAIVDRDTWERVCAELARRRQKYTGFVRTSHMLTGVLICSRCGTLLSHGRTRGTSTYRCKSGPGSPGCGRIQIAADPLERDLTAALFAYTDGTKLDELAVAQAGSPAVEIARELADLERDAAETSALAAAGKIRPGDFAAYSSGVQERQRVLRMKLARLSATVQVEPYMGRKGRLRAAWGKLTTSQRRGLILAAFGRMVVEPATGSTYDLGRVRRAQPAGAAQP